MGDEIYHVGGLMGRMWTYLPRLSSQTPCVSFPGEYGVVHFICEAVQ